MATNLPSPTIEDSAEATKLFFDSYGQAPLEFRSIDVDNTIAFFTKRGFGAEAALSVASVLLKQAKLEGVSVTSVLDSMSGFDELKLSALVSEILNNNRTPTSVLGYKTINQKIDISRNISA